MAGADAVKLQTYTADTITLICNKSDFILPTDNPWEAHNTLHALTQRPIHLGSGMKIYLMRQSLSELIFFQVI